MPFTELKTRNLSETLPSSMAAEWGKAVERPCFEFEIRHADSTDALWEDFLSLTRRLLKLFPFENVRIEVKMGRATEVFDDLDSYAEWVRAEELPYRQVYERLWVRRGRLLGLWTASQSRGAIAVKILTETSQSNPFEQACQSWIMGREQAGSKADA